MRHGDIELFPSAVIKNLKAESLVADPADLTKGKARIWFNDTEKKLKYYDGTETHIIAVGGNLKDYIRHDGTVAMTDVLTLSSNDQSAAADTAAVSKGYMVAELSKKEEVLTGAATSIAHDDLTADRALVADASGKVAVSPVTTTELGYMSGMTESVLSALAKKENLIGFTPLDINGSNAMTANLSLGGHQVTGVSKGTEADHAITLSQLENAVAGLDFQKDVNNVQVDNTLDVTGAVEGDRYVITDPANLHASFGVIAGLELNDIVEHDGTEFVVAYDVSVLGAGAIVWDLAGVRFVRYDGVSWDKFGGLSGVTAGICLEKDGDTINVVLGGGVVQGTGDALTVATYNGGALQLVDPATGLVSTDVNAVLSIKLDGASLVSSVDGVKVAAQGITEVELHASVAGNGMQGGNGSALAVKAADASLTVDETGVKVNETHTDGIYARQDGATFIGAIAVIDATDPTHAMPKSQIETTIDERAGNKIDEFAARFEASYDTYVAEAPSLVHDVVHNIGTKSVQVVCYDTNDNVFIPNSIQTTDENTVQVTLSEAIICRVEVQGMKPAPVQP